MTNMTNMTNSKIFIVDDDADFIDLQSTLLEAAGHEVGHETSSLDALARIKSERPDVIVIDIMMPGMDGLELCKRLRSDDELGEARIIVVSAKAYEFDRRRATKFGADGFIVKPIVPATFGAEVERIVEDLIEKTFWGVRGTLPVPGERALRYGGNTSCVSLDFPTGHFFIFDAGTGIKALSDHLRGQGRTELEAKICISHPHWDHINALPFFGPLYVSGNEFEICGAAHGDVTMREIISAQMNDVYFPTTLKDFGARVYFRDMREEAIDIDGIHLKTMLLSHPGYCLGYRVEYGGRAICYVTDNELYPRTSPFHNAHYEKRLVRFVAGADALIIDSTYTDAEYLNKVGWGHSSVGRVTELAHEAGVETLYLFHHDPDQSDADIDSKLASAKASLVAGNSATECLAPAEGRVFRI